MTKTKLILISVVVAVVIGTVYVVHYRQSQRSAPAPIDAVNPYSDQIQVNWPKPGTLVSSPLVVSGQARGTWYFEASFPVRLLDGDGQILAANHARAQADWMTNDWVPFTATLIFTAPATASGRLIIEKDNPSGQAATAAAITIPVRLGR